MNETEKKRYDEIQRSVNPKTKIRRVYKIEEDGSKTTARVVDLGYKAVFHNEDGPALINKEQRRKEYYLHGFQCTLDDWKEMKKERAGLPWYKNPSLKGTARL